MTDQQERRGFRGDLSMLESSVGTTFGPSTPLEVTQDRIVRFADATDDQQWIHVDADRAADGPFGATIAHGYLTLSLLPHFLNELVSVSSVSMGVNYGLNKVRFPAPLPSGSTISGLVTIASVQTSPTGAMVVFDVKVSAFGVKKPICIAQVVVLYMLGTTPEQKEKS